MKPGLIKRLFSRRRLESDEKERYFIDEDTEIIVKDEGHNCSSLGEHKYHHKLEDNELVMVKDIHSQHLIQIGDIVESIREIKGIPKGQVMKVIRIFEEEGSQYTPITPENTIEEGDTSEVEEEADSSIICEVVLLNKMVDVCDAETYTTSLEFHENGERASLPHLEKLVLTAGHLKNYDFIVKVDINDITIISDDDEM